MRLSIRTQIVALIAALLIGATSAYLYLAANLVTQDKVATLFDLSSRLALTLSDQLSSSTLSLVEKLLFFGAEQADANDASHRHATALFASDADVLALEVWQRSDGDDFRRTYRYVDAARLASINLAPGELDESRRLNPLSFPVLMDERVLLENVSVPPDVALLRVAAMSGDGRRAVVAELRPDLLLKTFSGATDSAAYLLGYLVDGRGRVVVHPDPAKVIHRADLSQSPVVRDALGANVRRGAREFTAEGRDLLASYAQLSLGRLAVVVEAPKAEALKASAELARRSLLLALGVISLALLASLYFSRRLTAPLRRLEQTMARVSRGEFGVEVPITSRNEIGAVGAAFNKMSRELSERETQLVQKNEQLIQSAKLSAVGELAAGLAHEVKNPMTGIVGFAQLGRSTQSLTEAHEYFGRIEQDSQRANSILQNLLSFARPSEVTHEKLDPNAVVEGGLTLAAHQLKVGGVRIDKELSSPLPLIEGNQNQLQQVLLNLFINAGQAMEGVEDKRLVVRTRSDGNGAVLIEVKDTGVGMSEEVRQRIFAPFFTTKPRGKGTGLGLSVSQSIVAQHKGELLVESAPGQGSTFTLRLPVVVV